ncbi:MAG: hypothetical protein HY900_35925 [Deltaproteobacteria bacterium]|nr:hypothetical protein [Deltaproteobacteria bacterium]
MSEPSSPAEKGSLTFFAAWLLLHEKADDWIRDALRRATETPEDLRNEYHRFLLAVEREKETLKRILSQAAANEVRQLGFVHREELGGLVQELEDLRSRLSGLEEKLERSRLRDGGV